ncbi:MAG: hypothetical protein PVF49_03090 [Anaerolineales bacterium]|jgi:hypothetical protein
MNKHKWIRRLLILSAISLAVVACAWFGGDEATSAVEAADGGIALTVYNEGTALVRDRRQFDLEEGFNQIAFTEVAASIDATSVLFMSLTDPDGTSVLEQNFEYDLVNSAALLEKYLDEEIVVVTTDGTRYSGILLSGRNDLIIQSTDGQVSVIKLENVQELSFPELPEGLITRPTLVWHLLAEQGGTHDVEVTYLTGGINWQADYVLLLSEDEQSIDLDGWITLSNTSGAGFVDAQLKLIAGDLQRVAELRASGDMDYVGMEETPAAAQVEEREFFEYHLYEIPRPVTVGDNETKQIEFVSVTSVPASKFFVYDGLQCASNYWACRFYGYANTDPSYGIASNPKVMVMVEFDTEQVEADLPRGRVRLYQEDVDGAALLVGEDTIDHTPEGELVRLYVGDAFDIVGERIQTDFRRPSSNTVEEAFEITIRNHKDEPIDIRIVEHLLRWSDWTILSSSDDYTKLDSSTIEFNVSVPANGETSVTYTVRYRWP